MRSATDFLPSYIRQFINLVRMASPNLGSGNTSRLTAARRRDTGFPLFWTLGAVFRTALTAILDALGIEGAADDVVTHPRKVFDPTAADQYHRMLLQVVTLAGNVARNLVAIGEANPRDLSQCGIRLLRCGGVDPCAHAPLLRTRFHRRHFVARHLPFPRLADQL